MRCSACPKILSALYPTPRQHRLIRVASVSPISRAYSPPALHNHRPSTSFTTTLLPTDCLPQSPSSEARHRLSRHNRSQREHAMVPCSTSHSLTAETEALHQNYAPLLKQVHASPIKAVICVTGGASQALGWILSEPGASRTVLECTVPYSAQSTVELLGYEPSQFCSRETAIALAEICYRRAVGLSSFGTPVAGLAATCGLISGPQPKRGDHRVWVAAHLGAETRVYGLKMSKGKRTRAGEDALAGQVLLKALADSCGIPEVESLLPIDTESGSEEGCESLEEERLTHGSALDDLFSGRVKSVEYSGGNVFVDSPRPGRAYLPGSFNPLHEGHEKLLETASRLVGRDGCYELAVCNADKGTLPKDVIEARVKQFVDRNLPVVLTMEPLFTGKAELFRDSTFVVGYDTAIRLVALKYYNNSEVEMARQFARLEGLGCSFAVAGRLDGDKFCSFDDVSVPGHLRSVFSLSIPEEELRVDISSTEIRKKMQENGQKK